MYSTIVKVAYSMAGVISLTMFASQAAAQLTPPSAIGNTAPPRFDSLPPRAFDNVRPVREQNFSIDSSSGSQQFFRQGEEKLYWLPTKNSQPILKINEEIETEEAKE